VSVPLKYSQKRETTTKREVYDLPLFCFLFKKKIRNSLIIYFFTCP